MKIKFTSRLSATLFLLAGIFPEISRGAVITVDSADGEIITNTAGVPLYTGNNAGAVNLPGAYYAGTPLHYVAPVQLPNLGPGTFTNVSFTITFESVRNTPVFNVDISGVTGTRPAPALQPADAAGGTLLVNNFWSASSLPVAGTTYNTGTGSATIFSSWLNAQYSNGANGGTYAFVRFSPDIANPPTSSGYNLRTANNGSAASRPFLNYDFTPVPEPSGTLLAGLAAVALMARRR